MTTNQEAVLRGELVEFRVRKPDGWCVIDFKTSDGYTAVTGVLPDDVKEGDTLELAGRFTENKYGKQFRASHLLVCLPGENATIQQWLAHHLPNIGPQRAEDLVRRFGPRLWDVLEKDPQSLATVNGITRERAQEILVAYQGVKAQRDFVVRLGKAGLDFKVAAQVAAELGANAEAQLQEDPYGILLRRRVQFPVVDAIALKHFKMDPKDRRRVRAMLQRVLFDKTYRDGHCYTIRFEVVSEAAQLLKLKPEDVEAALADYDGVVQHGKRLSLLEIAEAEAMVASRMVEFMEQPT